MLSIFDITIGTTCINAEKISDELPEIIFFFSKINPLPRKKLHEISKRKRILGIWSPTLDAERKIETAKRTMDFLNVDFPLILSDEYKELAEKFGIKTFPAAVMLNHDGTVIEKSEGIKEVSDFIEKISLMEKKNLASEGVGEDKNDGREETNKESKKGEYRKEENFEQTKTEYQDDEDEDEQKPLKKEEMLTFYFSRKKKIDGENIFQYPKKIASSSKKVFAVSNAGEDGEIIIITWHFFDLIDIIGERGKKYCKRKNCKLHDIELITPEGICFSEDSKKLLVCDFDDNKVKIINLEKKEFESEINVPAPKDITPYKDGFFYAVSWENKLFRIDIENKICEEVKIEENGAKLKKPSAILPSSEQNGFIISNSEDCSIVKINEKGEIIRLAGGKEGHKDGPSDFSEFSFPSGMGYHKDVFFIADTLNNSIRVLFDGKVATMILKDTELKESEDVKIIRGSILIADTGNSRILIVDSLSLQTEELKIEQYTPLWIDELDFS